MLVYLIEWNIFHEKYLPDSNKGFAIARSIIHRPQIIMADEPTGNLDPTLSLEILEFLKKINRENKITIIMVTHSPVAAEFGTMKLHLNEGKIAKFVN